MIGKTNLLCIGSQKITVLLLVFLLLVSQNISFVLAQDSIDELTVSEVVNPIIEESLITVSEEQTPLITETLILSDPTETIIQMPGGDPIANEVFEEDTITNEIPALSQDVIQVSSGDSSITISSEEHIENNNSTITGNAEVLTNQDHIQDLIDSNGSLQGLSDIALLPFDAIDYGLQTLFPNYDNDFFSLKITTSDITIETDEKGRIYSGTIFSANVVDEKSDMTFCSQVAYLNLKEITDLTGDADIARGNAIDIRKGSTGNSIDNDIIDILIQEHKITNHTVFDIVTYKPQLDTAADSYVRQSHRFVVFLGTDDLWYTLDPIRTIQSGAILFDDYLAKHIYEGESLKVVTSYLPSAKRDVSLPIDTYSSMELFAYAQQGLISPLNPGDLYPNAVVFQKHFVYNTLDKKIKATIPQGLIIATASGKPFDISKFTILQEEVQSNISNRTISSLSVSTQQTGEAKIIIDGVETTIPMVLTQEGQFDNAVDINKPKTESGMIEETMMSSGGAIIYEEQFDFGVSDQHLIFSKPIELIQQVDVSDGTVISLGVRHAGDESFGTKGLSIDPNTLCEDGNATIPGSQALVQSGQIRFRTCGASTFALTYTGGATTGNYVDAGFKEYTITFATGVQFPTGTTIGDIDVSIDWMPIDNESPTGPWGATNCYPGEKSFQIYHPDSTVVNLINATQLTTPNNPCPQVLNIFDDQTSNAAITTSYATGTYKPTAGQFLSSFNNKSPFGGWKLRMTDSAAQDGVILFGFSLSITTNPVIQNNSGNTMTIYYPEQSSQIIIDTISTDPNYTEGSGLTYTLTGIDASHFSINASGIVTWISSPLYDNPTDNGGNNIYNIQVVVTNAIGNTDILDLIIPVIRPIGASCRYQVDLATANTCITTTGGTVRCRGLNTNSQIADGTVTQRLIPTNSTLFGSNIRQVDAAQTASFVVTTTGQVRSIGANTNGQLGDGTLVNKTTPVSVLTGALRIYNTQLHTCAIMQDTSVRCRGRNANGQLGDNTIVQKLVPTAVVGGFTGVVDMALQSVSTCALKNNGTVRCRGSNANGRLGDGTTTQRLVPTAVVGGLTGVLQIAGGAGHMCALKNNGTVRCRGLNSNGQLGDNTTTQRLVPTAVAGGLTGVVSIAASTASTCALKNDGTIRCRGLNSNRELADGTTTQRLIPTLVTGMTGRSGHQIFAEGSVGAHFCASSTTGGLYCWGRNANGQLGNNSTTTPTIPVAVSGGVMIDVNALCPVFPSPVIQNNSGNTILTGYMENSTGQVIDTVTIDDYDVEGSGLTYTLTGVDKLLFSINVSGIVSWLSSPDYETPLDVGSNNIYNITIVVTDSLGYMDTIDLEITVLDVPEVAPIPGCISRDPRAWYKANDNNYNGTTWKDQSIYGRDADSNGTWFNDPSLTLVNFNPSYDFDSTNYWYHKGSPFVHDGNRGSMRYTVAHHESYVDNFAYVINQTIAGGSTENAALMADKTIPAYHAYDTDNASNTISAIGSDTIDPRRRVLTSQRFKDDVAISENGKELDRQTQAIMGSNYDMMVIGMQHDNGGNRKNPWLGRIPEVILYNDTHGDIDTYDINGDEDERIQTYLAIKYGQTLHHNYIDGYSNIIYDVNAGYANNIFGLGRESCEALYQKQSKSENPDALISVAVGDTLFDTNSANTGVITNDNSYLVIGDDMDNMSYRSNLGAPSGHAMLLRTWKSQNSNFVDNVFISAPGNTSPLAVKLPAPMTGVVKLVVDPDGNFSDGNATLYPMVLSGTDWVITGLSLTGIKYITFASVWVAGSLCIESPSIAFTGFIAKKVPQIIDFTTDYFKISDNRASDSGYYTTIHLSSLTGAYGSTILPSTFQRKADPIITLSGSINPLVALGPTIGSYINANTTVVLMKRDMGMNLGLTGTYGTKLNLRVSIPAYKSVDTYSGTITYTLYEN